MGSFKLKLVTWFALLALLPLAVAFYGYDSLTRRSETESRRRLGRRRPAWCRCGLRGAPRRGDRTGTTARDRRCPSEGAASPRQGRARDLRRGASRCAVQLRRRWAGRRLGRRPVARARLRDRSGSDRRPSRARVERRACAVDRSRRRPLRPDRRGHRQRRHGEARARARRPHSSRRQRLPRSADRAALAPERARPGGTRAAELDRRGQPFVRGAPLHRPARVVDPLRGRHLPARTFDRRDASAARGGCQRDRARPAR